MKLVDIRIMLIICVCLSACTEKPVEQAPDPVLFQAEQQIDQMLSQLDDDRVSIDIKKKILCGEFQRVYKNAYVPALMNYNKAIGDATSEKFYLDDLKTTVDRYKQIKKIDCALTDSP